MDAGSASITLTPAAWRLRRSPDFRNAREPMLSTRSRTCTPRFTARTRASATACPVASTSKM